MTATAQITVQNIANALLVPNASLRYSPPVAQRQESFSLTRMFMPRMPRNGDGAKKPSVNGERTIWTLKNNVPQSVTVTTGATDGKMTEIIKGELAEDTPLIISSKTGSRK
jgi:HlyD family secretion protein